MNNHKAAKSRLSMSSIRSSNSISKLSVRKPREISPEKSPQISPTKSVTPLGTPDDSESESAPYLTLSNSPNQKTNSIPKLSKNNISSGKQSIYRANARLQGDFGKLENLDEEGTLHDASMPNSQVNLNTLIPLHCHSSLLLVIQSTISTRIDQFIGAFPAHQNWKILNLIIVN